jgi:hypothetical protein
MTDFREEAYILENVEVSEDEEQDEFIYEEIKETMDLDGSTQLNAHLTEEDDDDDLNNFDALKAKIVMKQLQQTKSAGGEATSMNTFKQEAKPKVLEKDVVIDDFIRNFLQRFGMGKTLNIF